MHLWFSRVSQIVSTATDMMSQSVQSLISTAAPAGSSSFELVRSAFAHSSLSVSAVESVSSPPQIQVKSHDIRPGPRLSVCCCGRFSSFFSVFIAMCSHVSQQRVPSFFLWPCFLAVLFVFFVLFLCDWWSGRRERFQFFVLFRLVIQSDCRFNSVNEPVQSCD